MITLYIIVDITYVPQSFIITSHVQATYKDHLVVNYVYCELTVINQRLNYKQYSLKYYIVYLIQLLPDLLPVV